MERVDLIHISLVKYKEPKWSLWRSMSSANDRFSIDFGHYSIIVEFWFLRGGLKYD